MLFWIIFLVQLPAAIIIVTRFIKAASRQPPIAVGISTPAMTGKVSVIIPTLNEAERITPCLAGMMLQGPEVREIIVVDSNSTDGTQKIVNSHAKKDQRIRLITDDPLPAGWVGRPWALHTGFSASSPESEWVMGLDADTRPKAGAVAGVIAAAEAATYDLVSLSPQFILKYPGEAWLQPALLTTLIYRFGASGTTAPNPERILANGQLFFCRRSVLSAVNGYRTAKSSFCDDVTLARNIAAKGFKVGFLDGTRVLKVRMYEGMKETWQEWGRSLDLKDATRPRQLLFDLWLLLSTQALPLLIVLGALFFSPFDNSRPAAVPALLILNVFLLVTRWILLFFILPSYDLSKNKGRWLFWLSPTADPAAFWRIVLSSLTPPKKWRGRIYNRQSLREHGLGDSSRSKF